MMYKRTSQRGYSILELTVAAAITVGLTGTIFLLLKQNQEAFVIQSASTDLNQHFRATMDLLRRDVQDAGSGIPQFLGPVAGVDGGEDADGNQLSDEILLLYGKGTPVVVKNDTLTSLVSPFTVYGSSGDFTDGETYILYAATSNQAEIASLTDLTDKAEFGFFTLDSHQTNSDGLELKPRSVCPIGLPGWTNISEMPDSALLRVVALDEVVRYRVDKTTSFLQRSRNSDTQWVDVAGGITGLQIQYVLERKDPGTGQFVRSIVDDVEAESANNRALIRSVLITLTGVSQTSRGGIQEQRAISQTTEITPRNLVLPGFIPNR